MDINTISETRRSSRRSSSSRTPGSHQRRTRLIQILGIALALSLVINLVIAIALASYARKESLLSGIGSGLRLELASITEQSEHKTNRIKTLESEIQALTLNRLPGLMSLNFDEVIKVDKQYVKNIVFTRTGKKGSHFFEYKVVLENHNAALQPVLKILLFDRSGVQVGMSTLSQNTDQGGLTRLDQDEIRTHYSVVQLPDKAEPEYFQIVLL